MPNGRLGDGALVMFALVERILNFNRKIYTNTILPLWLFKKNSILNNFIWFILHERYTGSVSCDLSHRTFDGP